MKFSIFKSVKSRYPETVDYSPETITMGLTTPIPGITKKENVPVWSPTIFKGNRSGANSQYVTMLVYDIDDGTAISAWRCFSDHFVIVHTSYSHKPAHNKYRVIIPLLKPIPAKDWNRAHIAALEHWNKMVGVGEPDLKAIKDVARIYFRYAIPNSSIDKNSPLNPVNYHYSNYHAGPLFDLVYDHVDIQKKVVKKIDLKNNKSIDLSDIMLDTRYRHAVAEKLAANISGNNAKGIMCPQCNRPDVVFSIDINQPNSIKWPKCNHAGSCGWWGSFELLVGGVL